MDVGLYSYRRASPRRPARPSARPRNANLRHGRPSSDPLIDLAASSGAATLMAPTRLTVRRPEDSALLAHPK